VQYRYWGRAALAFGRHARRKPFLKQVAEMGLVADVTGKAPSRHVLDVYPDIVGVTVSMGDVTYKVWNMDPMERFCLAAIAKLVQPERIFEFGTFDGATTLLLARSVPSAQVFTLDLPPEDYIAPEAVGFPRSPGEYETPHEFRGTPEAERITQLLGDSQTFDYREFVGRVGLVVVDAGHGYEAASADSENALRLAGPSGVVVWDDYVPNWPMVMLAVNEATERHGLSTFLVRGTGFAIHDPSR